MGVLLSCLFRMLLWYLLTADSSALNLSIGAALALLLPHAQGPRQPLGPPSQRLVIFLEVLAITLTPFTLVLGLSRVDGRPIYRIHQLRPLPRHSRTAPSSTAPSSED